jgi:hypothetical protein
MVIAIYLRCSSKTQDTKAQRDQLESWAKGQSEPIQWFIDEACTGADTERPHWQAMLEEIRAGKISRAVCGAIDRCSRSVPDFLAFVDELRSRGVGFDFDQFSAGIEDDSNAKASKQTQQEFRPDTLVFGRRMPKYEKHTEYKSNEPIDSRPHTKTLSTLPMKLAQRRTNRCAGSPKTDDRRLAVPSTVSGSLLAPLGRKTTSGHRRWLDCPKNTLPDCHS